MSFPHFCLKNMIFIDAHAHIYRLSALGRLLDAAWGNFQSAAAAAGAGKGFSAVLLLAELEGGEVFVRLRELAHASTAARPPSLSGWWLQKTGEAVSLAANSPAGGRIYLVAGNQLVTSEGLEILALITDRRFDAGASINELIPAIRQQGGIPVIPWGFGKWTGRRGRLLHQLLGMEAGKGACLGDNGGRPGFAGTPEHFRIALARGWPILPGSDPLPIPADYRRMGSFGFFLEGALPPDRPAQSLKRLVAERGSAILPYGAPLGAGRFLFNQSMALLRKHAFRRNTIGSNDGNQP